MDPDSAKINSIRELHVLAFSGLRDDYTGLRLNQHSCVLVQGCPPQPTAAATGERRRPHPPAFYRTAVRGRGCLDYSSPSYMLWADAPKRLEWMASSRDDLREFPNAVVG